MSEMGIRRVIRFVASLAVVILATLASAGEALAEKRVALVVGNSAYSKFRPLKNPANDAHAVAEALKRAGFDVVQTVTDVNTREFYSALSTFSDIAATADAVVFYYAGHGVEESRVGYLLPVDIDPSDIRHIEFSTAPTTDVVFRALGRSMAPKIVILDACRTDPTSREIAVGDISIRTVSTRDVVGVGDDRKAGETRRDAGTLVVYSTSSEQVAFDGAGTNSPFAEAFVKRLADSSLSVSELFHAVASDVDQATDHQQHTNFQDSLIGTFRMNLGDNDALDWDHIRNSINPDDFDQFIKRHPTSAHASDAEWKRDVLLQSRHDYQADKDRKAAADKAAAEQAAQAESCKREGALLSKLTGARDEAGMASLRAGAVCTALGPAVDKAVAELRKTQAAELCDSERRRLDAAGADMDALAGAVNGLTCEAIKADGQARLARAEETLRRDKEAREKAVVEACRREGDQIGRMVSARNESGLLTLHDGATCKTLGPAFDKGLADIRAAKAVLACAAERRQIDAANTLDGLRGALAGLTCDAVRAEAQIRMGKLEDAQRALATSQAAAATCKRETDLLAKLKSEGGESGLEALRDEASCPNVRTLAEAAIGEVRVAKAKAVCELDRLGMEAAHIDPDALRGALALMTCAPVRTEAQARLAKLEDAQRATAAADAAAAVCRQEAETLSRLTADGDADGVSKLRDGSACPAVKALSLKSLAQIGGAKAKAVCERDGRVLDSVRTDPAALRDAIDKMACEDVKKEAATQLGKLDGDRKLAEIAQKKCEATKAGLESVDPSVFGARDQLVALRDRGGCSELRGDIEAKLELTSKRVRDVQNGLSRIGCYRGAPTGIFDQATKQGVETYFANAHAVAREVRLSVDLLAELEGRNDPAFCAPPAAPAPAPPVARYNPPIKVAPPPAISAAKPPAQPHAVVNAVRRAKQPSDDEEAPRQTRRRLENDDVSMQAHAQPRQRAAKPETFRSAMSPPSPARLDTLIVPP